MKKSKKLLLACLAVLSTTAMAGCGKESASNSYKGAKTYEEIAQQILKDRNISLDGLQSEKFSITGYQQGFSTDDQAWIAGLNNMARSGEEVILCAGASDLVLGMTGVKAEDNVVAGGVDSLTPGFNYFFSQGVYKYCDGKYSSMPGPMIANILRALEGNTLKIDGKVPYLDQGTWSATSADELNEMMAADNEGNYVYNANVISYMLNCDADKFVELTGKNDYASAKSYKETYGSTPLATLSKEYKIGIIRNDGTSDESVAFENYIKSLGTDLKFTADFVTTTSGDANADTNQVRTWASQSYDAVICLSNSALYECAKICNDNNMKFGMFAGHPYPNDETDLTTDFANTYVGSVGPSNIVEAKTGYKLAKYFIDQGYTKYAIFGGAIAFSAEMHAYRVAGMLAAMLENETGESAGL